MRLLLAVLIGVLSLTDPAMAMCSQSTVLLPDGRMLVCMTCCVAQGMCNTTCY